MILQYNARHFSESEFDCKCAEKCNMKTVGASIARPMLMNALVVIALDLIRERLKMPVRVNSGRRCVAHNAAIGGAKHSRHTKAEAADISSIGSSASYKKLVAAAIPVCAFLGLKVLRYDKEKFLHVQTSSLHGNGLKNFIGHGFSE